MKTALPVLNELTRSIPLLQLIICLPEKHDMISCPSDISKLALRPKTETDAIAVPKRLIACPGVTLYTIVTQDCYERMYSSCTGQKQSENSKKYQAVRLISIYVNIYENIIFLYYR